MSFDLFLSKLTFCGVESEFLWSCGYCKGISEVDDTETESEITSISGIEIGSFFGIIRKPVLAKVAITSV